MLVYPFARTRAVVYLCHYRSRHQWDAYGHTYRSSSIPSQLEAITASTRVIWMHPFPTCMLHHLASFLGRLNLHDPERGQSPHKIACCFILTALATSNTLLVTSLSGTSLPRTTSIVAVVTFRAR